MVREGGGRLALEFIFFLQDWYILLFNILMVSPLGDWQLQWLCFAHCIFLRFQVSQQSCEVLNKVENLANSYSLHI